MPAASGALSQIVEIVEAGPFPQSGIYAVQGITKMSQLEGKAVVASVAGGAADVANKLSVQAAGIPLSQVKFVYASDLAGDYAYLLTGKAQAILLSPPLPAKLASLHMTDIQSLASAHLEWAFTNFIAANRSYLSSHASAVTGFLKCYSDSITAVRAASGSQLDQMAAAEAKITASTVADVNEGFALWAKGEELIPVVQDDVIRQITHFTKTSQAEATTQAARIIDNSALTASGVKPIPAIS